jgi:hypothetical protein
VDVKKQKRNMPKGRQKYKLSKRDFLNSKDTVHLKTTRGHKIVVKKNSPYHQVSKKTGGTLLSTLRPESQNLSKEKDPLAVKNYEKRSKK